MTDNKLHTAVRYGNEEETLQALKEGFNPNEIGMLRWSPVHEASHNGERDILKLLLLFKGDVNQKDGLHGNTPLHYAAQEDNSACVTVLLKAGARWDEQNDQGRTALELATSSCKERMEPYLDNSQNTVSDEWKPGDPKGGGGGVEKTKDQTGWEGLDDVPSNASIGHLHLSFEFHKHNLKVRVWQITDLLMPPPQTSMIESVFVRGYFIPDPAKKSNRKTEDVLVDHTSRETSRKIMSAPQGGIQHIFTPSSFRFDNPLLYTGLTDEMVSKRSIQLEVCMTQKQTRKPFLMAMVHMPLRTAVSRPIRERYPLIPCMNYTIPNNMRVYSANDIFVDGKLQVSRSNSLQSNPDSSSSTEDPVTLQGGCLESVQTETPVRKLISVNISESYDDTLSDNGKDEEDEDVDDGIGSLDVKICSGKGSASSSVTVDILDTSVNDTDIDADFHLSDVVIDRLRGDGKETSVVNVEDSHLLSPNRGTKQKKKKIIPSELFVKTSDDENEDSRSHDSTVIEMEEPVKEMVIDMTRVGGDTVVEVDGMTDSGYDNESVRSTESPLSEANNTPSKRKKKVIPIEIATAVRGEAEGSVEGEGESNNNKLVSKSGMEDTGKDEEDEISGEIDSTRVHSTSSLPSPASSKGTNSTPAAGSRPETPVWDYYDFACDEGAAVQSSSQDGKSQATDMSQSSTTSPSKGISSSSSVNLRSVSSPVSTPSTLQDSLTRLSRPQQVLDTCRVSGPVLPSIITMEDFEMDDDN